MGAGVWSATPTPLTDSGRVDVESVPALVEQHLRLGVRGVMLAGTCGEGAWLSEEERVALTRAVVAAAGGRLRVAAQVTDNSAARVLANIDRQAAAGAEIAVVDAPWFMLNATLARRQEHFQEIARRSVLPLGFYDRGRHSPLALPIEALSEVLADPRFVMVKDSSQCEERRDVYLAARAVRPGLVLLTGDEFAGVAYLRAGYDGVLLGGGIFNGAIAGRLLRAARAGNWATAEGEQTRMIDLMHRVYGGPGITCWLTGLKELLVQMGVFRTRYSLLGYPLTPECEAQIRAAVSGEDGLGYRADLLGYG
jgi:4-hydroxy-tetrahydrodipicolinate synthase